MSDPINLGVLERLRDDVAKTLCGLGAMQGIAILTRRQGDAGQQIAEAFLSAGIFGEVSIHRAAVHRAQCKAVLLQVDFVVDFYENVPINQSPDGTRKGAWGLAEAALQALNYETLPGYGHVVTVSDGGPILEDVSKDPDGGALVVRVRLSTLLELPAPPPP